MLGFQRLSKVKVGTVGGDLPNEDAWPASYSESHPDHFLAEDMD